MDSLQIALEKRIGVRSTRYGVQVDVFMEQWIQVIAMVRTGADRVRATVEVRILIRRRRLTSCHILFRMVTFS